MTTKILTFRVPAALYSSLCKSAAESGISVSTHIKQLLVQRHDADQIGAFRAELLTKLDTLVGSSVSPSPIQCEVLLLLRAIASHLNPQLVAQVRARLVANQQGG